MNENKTKPQEKGLQKFLATLDENRHKEAKTLIDMMQSITDKPPVLWGTSIIGFDSYHYKSKSGREGDWMKIGFSPRKAKLSLYITGDASKYSQELTDAGKHSIGKGCIYINKLEDVDLNKLRKIIERAYEEGYFC